MLTLYHAPGQLSSRMVWLLEELEADYELVLTHFPQPDGSGAERRRATVRASLSLVTGLST